MYKHVLAAALTAATLLTGNAFAAGAYIGLTAGKTDASNLSSNLRQSQEDFAAGSFIVLEEVEDHDNSLKGFIGYAFNENFTLELSYADLGKTSSKMVSVDNPSAPTLMLGQIDELEITAVTLDAVGTLPITEKLSFFAKVGATKTKADYSFSWALVNSSMTVLAGDEGNESFKENGLHYGAGLGFDINDSFSLFTEYEVYQVKIEDDFDEDMKSLNLGAKLKF